MKDILKLFFMSGIRLHLVYQFSIKMDRMIAWNSVQLLVELKLIKKIWGPSLGKTDQNWIQNQIFCHFLKYGSLDFLEIAQDESLEQYLTTSRRKAPPKFGRGGGGQVWVKYTKIGPQIRFFVIFSSTVRQFSFKMHRMIIWNNV